MTVDFEDESFDVIYSRDTILHISDKPALFARFMRWLKPGGKLMITDYCRGTASDPEFDAYVKQRGYDLHTVSRYGGMIEGAGFVATKAVDYTKVFVESLQAELHRMKSERARFLETFEEADFDYLMSGWEAKIRRYVCGSVMCWSLGWYCHT